MDKDLAQHLAAGIVITGGGAQIPGLVTLAKQIFDSLPVRIAKPENLKGLVDDIDSSIYSTAIGLIKYRDDEFTNENEKTTNIVVDCFLKLKNWIKTEY